MSADKKRKDAAERKRKSRAKLKAHAARLDMRKVSIELDLAKGERTMLAINAAARDYEDQDEYVMRLVSQDRAALIDEGCDLSQFDEFGKRDSHKTAEPLLSVKHRGNHARSSANR